MTLNETLLKGNNEFRDKYYGEDGLMIDLVENGQHPDFAFIACTDSRNDPINTFQLEPGDAFSFRTMGTLFPRYSEENELSQLIDSHLTFYIEIKNVKELNLVGHTDCGGAQAIAADIDNSHITPWLIPAGKRALEQTKEKMGYDMDQESPEFLRALEEEIIIVGHESLMTYPVVIKAIEEGTLKITALLNELETGTLHELDPTIGKFFPANEDDSFAMSHDFCLHDHSND